jgi:hypothetical protein
LTHHKRPWIPSRRAAANERVGLHVSEESVVVTHNADEDPKPDEFYG